MRHAIFSSRLRHVNAREREYVIDFYGHFVANIIRDFYTVIVDYTFMQDLMRML